MGERTKVTLSTSGDTTVIKLAGELTQPDAPDVAQVLSGPGLGRGAHVVLDLTDLAFIDSTGIALLLRLKRRSVEEDFGFKLAGLTDGVRSRLDRTGLLTMMLEEGSPDARPGGVTRS